MTTSGRIHGEFLRLLYFISNKQAVDYFRPSAMTRTKKNFVIVVASSSTTTAAPLEWHVSRPLRCAAPPRQRGAPTAARRHVAAPQNQQPSRSDPHEFDRLFIQLSDVG